MATEEEDMSDEKLLTMKSATLCYLTTATHVVLAEMLRGPFAGYLNGYGGEIHPQETALAATIRELQEESGVTAQPAGIAKRAVIDFYNFKNQDWRRVRVYVSVAQEWTGTPAAGDGMGPPEKYPFHQLPFEHMLLGDWVWIERMLRGELLSGEIWYGPGHKTFAKQPVLTVLSPTQLDRLWNS